MKIFKRPMFRKGGEVGGGIMTGLRENYEIGGSTRERLAKVMAEYPSTTIDPLSQFLIQGGLKLASQPATGGGAIADIATALQEPTAGLMKGLGERGKMERELALQGEILDIESEQAEKLARIKNQMKDQFAAETPEEQFEVLFKGYSDSNNPILKGNAKNLATFEVLMNTKFPNKSYTQLSFEYGTDPRTKKKDYLPQWGSIPVGSITFNPKNNMVLIRKTKEFNDARDFAPLDPSTLNELGD